MKKKILTSFILASLFIIALGVISASAAKEGYLTCSVSNGEATITDCDTSISGDLVIPDTLGGYPVARIGNSAFYNCSGLTSVTIPDSVKSIGEYAFKNCTGLTSITIPDSVESIGDDAFYNCTGLTSITIPDSVESIGNYAFYNCDGLTSVTIGSGVTGIGNYAFYNCTGLTSVTIPDSVTSIGYSAFEYCSGLTSVTIPDSVESIGNFAFYNCSGLTSVTIPDGVTSIGYCAFYNCSGLTSVTIPDGVTSIGDSAFSYCSGLTSITIPDGVTSIGNYAFEYCSGLTSITIPDGVTSIGDSAFSYCSGLTSVTIPDSVTSIGDYAFRSCTGLTSVTIGEGLELIPENIFYDCEKLKFVALSKNIKYIRNDAFNNCGSIETVFYEGNESEWNEILFYDRNENLTNAKIVYNAVKKTYSFVTNCDKSLPDVTDYAIYTMPTVENERATLSGWYDNAELEGEPVSFPYYGDATTLYAAWIDRTGKSFDDAFITEVNREYTVTTTESGQFVYFEFVPKVSKTYHIYSTGSKDTYGYLYNDSEYRLTSDNDSGDGSNFFISYNLTAGKSYYIGAKVYNGSGTFTVVIEDPVDYKIEEISITDMSGNAFSAIPTDKFLASVSFTNVSSSEDTVIVLAQYTESGVFNGLMYVKTKNVPVGSTIELSIPVDNTSGEVAKLKAFCWESLGTANPMGEAVTFPAE